jgi:hypothetical protein
MDKGNTMLTQHFKKYDLLNLAALLARANLLVWLSLGVFPFMYCPAYWNSISKWQLQMQVEHNKNLL